MLGFLIVGLGSAPQFYGVWPTKAANTKLALIAIFRIIIINLSIPISLTVFFLTWSSDLQSATSIGVASKAIGWLNIQAGVLPCLLK